MEHTSYGSTSSLKYLNIGKIKTEANFVIWFSVLIERDAHIFLCDDDYPPYANCYWFLLAAFMGSSTAIRKCGRNQIPNHFHVFAQDDCKDLKNRTNVSIFRESSQERTPTGYEFLGIMGRCPLYENNGKYNIVMNRIYKENKIKCNPYIWNQIFYRTFITNPKAHNITNLCNGHYKFG